MSKKPKSSVTPASDKLVKASYNAGLANGRVKAIEESMDAVAALIFKAEGLLASLGSDAAQRDNADHTLRALRLAFAAVTGSTSGSPAFEELLEQSRRRLDEQSSTMH